MYYGVCTKLYYLSPIVYGGTSLNRHLPIAATSLMQSLDAVLIEALLILNADTSLFRKVFGPSSTWTVQNFWDNVDAGMPLAQDYYPLRVLCSSDMEHTHTCAYTHAHTHTHMHAHTHTHTHMHARTHTHTRTRTHARTHTHTHKFRW